MAKSYDVGGSGFKEYVTKFAHLLRFGGIAVLLVSLLIFGVLGKPVYVNLASDFSFVLLAFGVGLELFYHFLEGEIWA